MIVERFQAIDALDTNEGALNLSSSLQRWLRDDHPLPEGFLRTSRGERKEKDGGPHSPYAQNPHHCQCET